MICKLVIALCVTVTFGDYVLPGIGVPGRYPERPPPMMPVEEDSDDGPGQLVWIAPEEVEDDSDIEEVPEVVPGASSSRSRRQATTSSSTKSTEGRRRRDATAAVTKSTDGRRRRNVTVVTKSTKGRRRRNVTVVTKSTEGS